MYLILHPIRISASAWISSHAFTASANVLGATRARAAGPVRVNDYPRNPGNSKLRVVP